MASPTADPFEGPVAPAVREDAVREAVAFLNDPRVKAADPARAQAFLQQKGMAPAEVREAFRRCALPLPPSAGAVRAFAAPPQQLVVPPPREGRSWFGVFMGVVAAAGLYTAVREVLKRYVVPLYFPDAARVAEERRRREEAASRQERQLEDLKTTVQDLAANAQKTSDKLDMISVSLSSRVQKDSQAENISDLRNAIHQLSRSVSASGGSEIVSHDVMDRLRDLRGEVDHLKLLSTGDRRKAGSLAYVGVNSFDSSAAHESRTSPHDVFQTPMTSLRERENQDADVVRTSDNKQSTDVVQQSSTASPVADGGHDDFMDIAPAEVDRSWGVQSRLASTQDSSSTHTGPLDQNGDSAGPPADGVVSQISSEAVDTLAPADQGVGPTSGTPASVTEMGMQEDEIASFSTARKLFEKKSNGEIPSADKLEMQKARPLSMPPLETPLSDTEV